MFPFLIARAAAALAQADGPEPPVEAIYVVREAKGTPVGGNQIGDLLRNWYGGPYLHNGWNIRKRLGEKRLRSADMEPCLSAKAPGTEEIACLRRIYPQRLDGLPVVLVVPRDVGGRDPALAITCLGPDGVGQALVSSPKGGALSPDRDERRRGEAAVAGCLSAALEKSALRYGSDSPGTRAGFNHMTAGDGLYFYQGLSADCDGLEHRSGRNAVGGRWRVPLKGARWKLVPPQASRAAALMLECEPDAPCIQFTRGSRQARLATHRVQFGDANRARVVVAHLDELKRTCSPTR